MSEHCDNFAAVSFFFPSQVWVFQTGCVRQAQTPGRENEGSFLSFTKRVGGPVGGPAQVPLHLVRYGPESPGWNEVKRGEERVIYD